MLRCVYLQDIWVSATDSEDTSRFPGWVSYSSEASF